MATIPSLGAVQAAAMTSLAPGADLPLEGLLPPPGQAQGVLPPDLAGPEDAQAAAAATSEAPAVDRPRHVGDAILSVVNHLHRDLSQSWQAVQSTRVNAPTVDLKAGDLLALQRDLVMFSFHSEVAGKGTSKFIDNINQTVKMS